MGEKTGRPDLKIIQGEGQQRLKPGDAGWESHVSELKWRGKKIPERVYRDEEEGRSNLIEEEFDNRVILLHDRIQGETGVDLSFDDTVTVFFSVDAIRTDHPAKDVLNKEQLYTTFPALSSYFDRVLNLKNQFVPKEDAPSRRLF